MWILLLAGLAALGLAGSGSSFSSSSTARYRGTYLRPIGNGTLEIVHFQPDPESVPTLTVIAGAVARGVKVYGDSSGKLIRFKPAPGFHVIHEMSTVQHLV